MEFLNFLFQVLGFTLIFMLLWKILDDGLYLSVMINPELRTLVAQEAIHTPEFQKYMKDGGTPEDVESMMKLFSVFMVISILFKLGLIVGICFAMAYVHDSCLI